MNKATLIEAIAEAHRFLNAAEKLQQAEAAPLRKSYYFNPREQGAVKRASMDLTRKLADLRLGR